MCSGRSITAYDGSEGSHQALEIRAGHPAQTIVHWAKEKDADLIVIGHCGHSGMWGLFLGGTAEKVSRHASCPSVSCGNRSRWRRHTRTRRITCPPADPFPAATGGPVS